MDQAYLLRKMMNDMEVNKTVSICTTGGVLNSEKKIKKMVAQIAENTIKKIVLQGIYEMGKPEITDWLLGREVDAYKEAITSNYTYVPGDMNFFSVIKKRRDIKHKYLSYLKEVEKKNHIIITFSGTGIDVKTVNVSMMSNKIIILTDSKKNSLKEVLYLKKIFKEIDKFIDILVIIEKKDERINLFEWNNNDNELLILNLSENLKKEQIERLLKFIEKEERGERKKISQIVEEKMSGG